MQSSLRDWLWRKPATDAKTEHEPDSHRVLAHGSLAALLDDDSIPAAVRTELQAEFDDIRSLLDKLEHGHIHIAVFGRVSVGKSSLLNALLGQPYFSTSPLHGETRTASHANWQEYASAGTYFIDTPGIDEQNGDAREAMARKVCERADLVLFVCDSDLTEVELSALQSVHRHHRPIILVLNKADRYTRQERDTLLNRLRERTAELVPEELVLEASADPRPQKLLKVDTDGNETVVERETPPDVLHLKRMLWRILEQEGQTLAALNASVFAADLDATVAGRIIEARASVTQKVVRGYCIGKGLAVAVNPIPVADLLAAAALDVALVVHLGEIYGFKLSRSEAGRLVATIVGSLAALMGTVWGVNLVSSALKGVSAGLSTAVTAGAQGALAYYATYLIGQAAEHYFKQGKSWGDKGAKSSIRRIVDSLDRNSILLQAREEILIRLQR